MKKKEKKKEKKCGAHGTGDFPVRWPRRSSRRYNDDDMMMTTHHATREPNRRNGMRNDRRASPRRTSTFISFNKNYFGGECGHQRTLATVQRFFFQFFLVLLFAFISF